jgi:hypothetical protein
MMGSRINHKVWKHCRTAGKPFFPNGQRYQLDRFQERLFSLKGKIKIAQNLIRDYGLSGRVFLGTALLLDTRNHAVYLYDNVIHPRFFAESIHVIGNKAKLLAPIVDKIQLRRLQRDNLAQALESGMIRENEIGKHFELFSRKSPRERLEILNRLGVITLKEGVKIADLFPKPEAKGLEPKPPIAQLDLFEKE